MIIDNEKYRQFCNGNLDAFYREAYPSLLSMANRMLSPYYSYMAEDCVQEAVCSAWRNRENFISPSNLKSYLFACVHNEAVNILRKNTHKQKYHQEQNVLRIDLGVDEQYLIQEALDTLYEIIDSLPEEYRKIFELSYVKGLKNEEIARELNLSLSGTKKRKARFLELLREKLSKHTGDTLLWMMIFQICQRMTE